MMPQDVVSKPIAFALLALLLAAAVARADEVHLRNGDRLSGEVLRLEGDKLTVLTPYAGTVEIERAAVAEIDIERTVPVHLEGGEVLHGTLSARDGVLWLSPSADREGVALVWEKIAAIAPKPPQEPRWHGNLTLGGNQQSGNTDRASASASLEASRRSAGHRFSWRLLHNYGEEDDAVTVRNTYGTFKYDHFLTVRLYGYLGVELLNDRFKDLNLRTVAGPGVGYQVWEEPQRFLLFEGGVSYFNEDHIDSKYESWFGGRLACEFRYTLFDHLEFAEKLALYPSLEDPGSYQLRNEASLTTPLFTVLAMKLSHIVERDSEPAEGVRENDYYWILGLQYGF